MFLPTNFPSHGDPDSHLISLHGSWGPRESIAKRYLDRCRLCAPLYPSPQWGLLLKGGREGEGPNSKGDKREGKEETGDGKGGEGNFPQSQGM